MNKVIKKIIKEVNDVLSVCIKKNTDKPLYGDEVDFMVYYEDIGGENKRKVVKGMKILKNSNRC